MEKVVSRLYRCPSKGSLIDRFALWNGYRSSWEYSLAHYYYNASLWLRLTSVLLRNKLEMLLLWWIWASLSLSFFPFLFLSLYPHTTNVRTFRHRDCLIKDLSCVGRPRNREITISRISRRENSKLTGTLMQHSYALSHETRAKKSPHRLTSTLAMNEKRIQEIFCFAIVNLMRHRYRRWMPNVMKLAMMV